MRDRTWQNRITMFLGILLSVGMVAGLILPLLQNNLTNTTIVPTAAPAPTQPAPLAVESITFDTPYLHPSGLFTANIPTGWIPITEFSTTGEAQVTMRNADALSVLEIRVIRPTLDEPIATVSDLNTFFDQTWLSSSWREYTSWSEATRRVDGERQIIDFNLSRQGQDYIARQTAFTDGTWVYAIRVVTPSNASQVLTTLLEGELNAFAVLDRFVGAPMEWSAFFSNSEKHLIRYPATWTLADAAENAPASIAGAGVDLRVETTATTIDSESAASDYVTSLRSGVTVLSTTAVEQFGVTGYRVAYTVANLDGDSQSGAVLLLNGDGKTHVANVLLASVPNTDLNSVDVSAEGTSATIQEALATLATFSLLPEVNANTTVPLQ